MRIKLSVFCLSLALVLTSMPSAARADEWNKETRITVNEPLEVPGAVLTPGTYIFKLADSVSDRRIVEIYSEDASGRQNLVTTILAISAYRLETPDKPVINLEERPSGRPGAIHSWFYPGDNAGWQFVYPKSDRLEVATNQAPIQQAAPVVALPPAPPVETVVDEPVVSSQLEQTAVPEEEAPVLVPETSGDLQGSADVTLPETAGHSIFELLAGFTLFGLSLLTVFVGLRVRETPPGVGGK